MVSFEQGTFTVNSSGEIKVDYIFDGGWFRGELAVFSLAGMDNLTPGSTEFMLEAGRRALTNSSQGYIAIQDELEAARFETTFPWEPNFNIAPYYRTSEYEGVKTFNLTPGDEVAFMLVQNNTVQDTLANPGNIYEFGKLPLFSIPEANILEVSPDQFTFLEDYGNGGIIAGEDVPIRGADKDYNDIVFQIDGLEGNLSKLEDHLPAEKNWLADETVAEISTYANASVFNNGVFQVSETGEIIIDFLYDGGLYEGEVGIFSLAGLEPEEINSEGFIEEAIFRAQSNSNLGHVVMRDAVEAAKYNSDLRWEPNFNAGNYQGRKTFLMNPGDLFGLVLVPNGTLNQGLTSSEGFLSRDPIFSMSELNHNDQIQFTDILTGAEGSVVGFEDQRLDNGSEQDFNDIIMSIEGIGSPIGVSVIEDVINTNHNWLDQEFAENIVGYFDNSDMLS